MSRKKKFEKPKEEYNATVGDGGEILPSTPEVKKVKYVEPDTVVEGVVVDELPVVWQIRDGTFPKKSQFLTILLSVFVGMFGAHDWYLGLKKRALYKYVLFGLGAILGSILFSLVASEASISYNFMFQSMMMAPLLAYVLWWSFDFITVVSKRSKHFKMKDKTTCVHKLKADKERGGYYCKKCSAKFDEDKNFLG